MRGVPPAEVDIDDVLVRRLLTSEAPQLAGLPLHAARNGWDNRIWRLGDALAVRLPRREAASRLLLHEQLWLGDISTRLTLPVPAPVVLGTPQEGYPWAWSVVPWFDGEVAARERPAADEAATLGAFLRGLHVAAPDGAPTNPFRGVPLAARSGSVETWLAQEHAPEDAALVTRAGALVARTAAEPQYADRPRWLHGDLHPRNILVRDGRLAAVLDWGDVCAGDPATDLATVWWLFDQPDHAAFWEAYGETDHATRRRARAWAAMFGLMFLHFATADDPALADAEAADLGRDLLRRVLGPAQVS